MMQRLLKIDDINKIPELYKGTAIEKLVGYHNLGQPPQQYKNAELLIAMCMDNRISLHLPDNFSYIIRTGGANLKSNEFYISYSIAVGNVKGIAVIGHDQCGMAELASKQDIFVDGLVKNAGWDHEIARQHFEKGINQHEVGDEIKFILDETNRLRDQYPKIVIAPMMYLLVDHKLYFIRE